MLSSRKCILFTLMSIHAYSHFQILMTHPNVSNIPYVYNMNSGHILSMTKLFFSLLWITSKYSYHWLFRLGYIKALKYTWKLIKT